MREQNTTLIRNIRKPIWSIVVGRFWQPQQELLAEASQPQNTVASV